MKKLNKSVETAVQTGNLFSNTSTNANDREYSEDKIRNAFQFLTHCVRIAETLKKNK